MNSVPFPIGPCLLLLVCVAMATDLRTRRIPNWLVASGLVVALGLQCAIFGVMHGALLWLGGCLTGGLLFLPSYLVRMMGAGDVKLMAAVGSFCGAMGALEIAVAATAIGGALAVLTMIWRRRVRDGVRSTVATVLAMPAQAGGTPHGVRHNAMPSVGGLPYGVAIALGTVCVLYAGV